MPEIALTHSRGCGNPIGFADVEPGEVVVDFGCGGGLDVILASHKVGRQGRVIGIDFAPQMIKRAKKVLFEAGLQDRDIEFRTADLEKTQIADCSSDVVISNCVINLCPNKDAVYKEAFRILRPGGRLAISDIILTEKIDPELQGRFQATWAGCMGGSLPKEDYLQIINEAGFTDIQIIAHHLLTPEVLAAMACCPSEELTPSPNKEDLALVQGKVASIKFTAVKPRL